MSDIEHARLLLAILRGRWDDAERIAGSLSIDPSTFVDACLQADVPSWVHARLVQTERTGLVDPETLERLARIRERVCRDNLLLIARAEQALAALLDAGVVPVALKGLDLLYRVYAGIDERTLDDVDLLVRPADLRPTIAALEAQGWQVPPEPKRTHYIRTSHHLPMTSPGPVPVDFEIHWNLAQERRYHIDEQALHDRAVPIDIGGRCVRRLDDHDLVAHLLLHHFTHYFDRRVKWTLDLEAVSRDPQFDWSVVVERVRSWGATAACGMSLLHLHKLIPECIPRTALDGLRVAAWRRALTGPLRSSHPLELFRGTRRRWFQLYVAAVLLEHPSMLPGWLAHRTVRGDRAGDNPLDDPGASR